MRLLPPSVTRLTSFLSSRERLDMVGKLANYGIEHWGSDTMGINTTRRFLCEALSFQHRYIPVGLLERLPIALNERAMPYRGRDELEVRPSSFLSYAVADNPSSCADAVGERPVRGLGQAYVGSELFRTLRRANVLRACSSMFLGPPPEEWSFQPKHKANATVDAEVQG